MLDIIEQLTALRGTVRALEAEWDDMRTQIRKGYQRMEKAHERAATPAEGKKRKTEPPEQLDLQTPVGLPAARGFAAKLEALKETA